MANTKSGYLARHGIVPWHVFLFATMVITTIAQFVSFRTHAQDFEDAAKKEIARINLQLTELDKRVDTVSSKYGVIDARLDHIDRQVARLVEQNDRIIERFYK